MKKTLLLCLFVTCFVLVWCGWWSTVKEVVSVEKPIVQNTVEVETPPVEEPVVEPEQPFDPDNYEDEEIDALLGLLEWLVEW